MSEWRDYLIEIEWSVPGVEEENTADSLTEIQSCRNVHVQGIPVC